MRALVLDISSSTGWSLFEGEQGSKPNLLLRGTVVNKKTTKQHGEYPYSFLHAAGWMADQLLALVQKHAPDVVVVEETNPGKANRYSQKYLEFIHCSLLSRFYREGVNVKYVSSADWRSCQNVRLTDEDKKRNRKLAEAKRRARKRGSKISHAEKKELGIAGKFTIKHAAIRRANELYDLGLRPKDDDVADAIVLGVAYFAGVKLATGG